MKRILLILITTVFLSFSKGFAYDNITENQVINVKLYSLKAMNLVLKSYSLLNLRRKNIKEIKTYLQSALFFLNEARDYSPSYMINKKIDTLVMRIQLFPEENFKADLISLKFEIKNIRGNIPEYEKVKNMIEDMIKTYKVEKNSDLILSLDKLKKYIKVPLIDETIENAQTFIAIAYDNLNMRKYQTAKKSLEIALDPLIKITSREYIYLVIFKDLIYKSYLAYQEGATDEAINSLKKAKKYLENAYEVCEENKKDLIKGFLTRLDYINNNFSNRGEVLKEYIFIIRDLKNL